MTVIERSVMRFGKAKDCLCLHGVWIRDAEVDGEVPGLRQLEYAD